MKVTVRVRWEGGGSISDLFRAAKELKAEKAETGCGIGENPCIVPVRVHKLLVFYLIRQ